MLIFELNLFAVVFYLCSMGIVIIPLLKQNRLSLDELRGKHADSFSLLFQAFNQTSVFSLTVSCHKQEDRQNCSEAESHIFITVIRRNHIS